MRLNQAFCPTVNEISDQCKSINRKFTFWQ